MEDRTPPSRCKTGLRITTMKGVTATDQDGTPWHFTFWKLEHAGDVLEYSTSWHDMLAAAIEWTVPR